MNDNPPTNGSPEPQWVPVVDAVVATGMASRTLYRWVRAKQVPSRREGRVVLVDLAAVQQKARERHAIEVASGAGVPANVGRVANGSGKVTYADGDVASRVFDLLDQDVSPAEIVRRERIAPSIVLGLCRDYLALKDAALNGKPSVASRLDAQEAEWREQVGGLSAFVADLDRKVDRLCGEFVRYSKEAPVPPSSAIECPSCKTIGLVTVPVSCTHCGFKMDWGFRE